MKWHAFANKIKIRFRGTVTLKLIFGAAYWLFLKTGTNCLVVTTCSLVEGCLRRLEKTEFYA